MKEGVVKSTNVALSWQAAYNGVNNLGLSSLCGANVNVLDQMVNIVF